MAPMYKNISNDLIIVVLKDGDNRTHLNQERTVSMVNQTCGFMFPPFLHDWRMGQTSTVASNVQLPANLELDIGKVEPRIVTG